MHKNLIFILSLFIVSIFYTTTTHAKIIEKVYDRVYTVENDYVEITETKTIGVTQSNFFIQSGATESFTIFNPVRNDPNGEAKANQTLASINLTDNFGNQLQYTSETSSNGNLVIKTQINKSIFNGETYTINLRYKSYGLIIKSGAVRDVYVPSFPENYEFEDEQSIERVSTKLVIPKRFGEINFIRPQIGSLSEGVNYVLNFSQQDLLGATAWVQIGTTQYYEFEINQPYTASSSIPILFNQYKVILPRDISSGPINQKVFFTELTPAPFSTEIDNDGNLIAVYRLPVNQEGDIIVKGYAIITQDNSVNFVNSGTLDQIPADILQNNTAPAKFWESDSDRIQEVAQSLKGNETNVYKLTESAYKYVISKIDYSEVRKFGLNQRQGALATLQGGAAVCMEYSDLFIALLRAMGVPARAAFGSGYSALDGLTSGSNTVNHQWAEVYIPSINSWIGVDTTWGENGDTLIGGDLNHFYTHVASINPETPPSTEATLYGRDGIFKDRTITVSAIENAPSINSITFTEISERYPKRDLSGNVIESVFGGISLLVFNIDTGINNLLGNIGISESLFTPIKILTVIILFIAFIFIGVTLRKKKKNETIYKY